MKKPKYKIGEQLKFLSKNPFAIGEPIEELHLIIKSFHEFNRGNKYVFRYIGFVPEIKMEQWIEESELYP